MFNDFETHFLSGVYGFDVGIKYVNFLIGLCFSFQRPCMSDFSCKRDRFEI